MKRNSNVAARRLPGYYRYLNELHSRGVEQVSSRMIGERLRITASLVRKDLSRFGEFGQAGYCYNVAELCTHIGHILGVDRRRQAIVIGAESLGRSLLYNLSFSAAGFFVEAIFDHSPDLIGTEVRGIPVLDMAGLEAFVQDHRPDTAILTLSNRETRKIARYLSLLGVRQFWNISGAELGSDAADTWYHIGICDYYLGEHDLTVGRLQAALPICEDRMRPQVIYWHTLSCCRSGRRPSLLAEYTGPAGQVTAYDQVIQLFQKSQDAETLLTALENETDDEAYVTALYGCCGYWLHHLQKKKLRLWAPKVLMRDGKWPAFASLAAWNDWRNSGLPWPDGETDR